MKSPSMPLPLATLLLVSCLSMTACEAAAPDGAGPGESWPMTADGPTSNDPAEFVGEADAGQNTLNLFEQYGGWELLFDGQSMDSFRRYNGGGIQDQWQIVNGAMVLTHGGGGDIITKQKYDSYELQLEYKISTGGNSGIMFRVEETDGPPWHTGPEVQINDHEHGHDPQKAGWLYQMYQAVKPKWANDAEAVDAGLPTETDAARPAGEWNHVYLKITPGECQVLFNGVSYYKFQIGSDDWNRRWQASKFAGYDRFAKSELGHICLQDHGNMVAFRNLKVRQLDANGQPPEPIDGELPLQVTPAFGEITWEDWEPIDDGGKLTDFRPICMTHAGDGSGRMFVAEQKGSIHVIQPQDGPQDAPMLLDLRDVVQDYTGPGRNEEGLLGLAFHPDFQENGEFFVYYTTNKQDLTSIVSRFTMSKDDPNKADRDSEVVVMEIPQAFHNHNGGAIEFGPDGYLYIGLGDGGSADDPYANGQSLATWLGKILRIDVDQRDGGQQYGIPADNPFVDVDGAKPEIYAYGFRNPWRITFDRQRGDLWEGEVGQDYWEEINIVTKGGNYGWSWVEGTFPFEARAYNMVSEPMAPIWEYDHQVGKSITGGYVYRGPSLPELNGVYLYADFVTGKIWGLKYDREAGKVEWNKAIPSDKLTVLAFGEDESGEIYFSVPTATGQGIYKFTRAE